jgi:hypothetical protein
MSGRNVGRESPVTNTGDSDNITLKEMKARSLMNDRKHCKQRVFEDDFKRIHFEKAISATKWRKNAGF